MSCPELLPVNRGYNSSLGYLSGAEDHYANTRVHKDRCSCCLHKDPCSCCLHKDPCSCC